MRLSPAVPALLLLCGCDGLIAILDEPEVRACEHYLKETLLSPSSYKRRDVTTWREQITSEELNKITKNSPLLPNEDPALVFVGIEYEAVNNYGVKLEGAEICAFEANGEGIVDSGDSMMSKARMAASAHRLRSIVPDAPPAREHDCCLR